MRVAGRQLQQWYRTLDQLIECKAQIEHTLYLRLRDLFSLQVDPHARLVRGHLLNQRLGRR